MWEYNYDYLCHGTKGYKYIDRKMGKNGRWIYTYPGDNKPPTPKPEENPDVSKAVGSLIGNAAKKLNEKIMTGIKDNSLTRRVSDITAAKKQILKAYKQSEDSNLSMEERKQNEKAISQIIETVRNKYGDHAAEVVNQYYVELRRPLQRKKNVLPGSDKIKTENMADRAAREELIKKVENMYKKMDDGTFQGQMYSDLLDDLIYWYNGGVPNPNFTESLDYDEYVKEIERMDRIYDLLKKKYPNNPQFLGIEYDILRNHIDTHMKPDEET